MLSWSTCKLPKSSKMSVFTPAVFTAPNKVLGTYPVLKYWFLSGKKKALIDSYNWEVQRNFLLASGMAGSRGPKCVFRTLPSLFWFCFLVLLASFSGRLTACSSQNSHSHFPKFLPHTSLQAWRKEGKHSVPQSSKEDAHQLTWVCVPITEPIRVSGRNDIISLARSGSSPTLEARRRSQLHPMQGHSKDGLHYQKRRYRKAGWAGT